MVGLKSCNTKVPRWEYTRRFPRRYRSSHRGRCVTIGIGGNVGDVRRRFDRVVDYLVHAKRVQIVATSALLYNRPFGYLAQPHFYNAIVQVRTYLDPWKLIGYLLWVEKRFGRTRKRLYGPRTLDLDIIFIEKFQGRSRRLVVPHPYWHERLSVVAPLLSLRRIDRCD